jgi:arylsulfatase
VPAPEQVNGVLQEPLHGTSMVYAFADAGAAERHETQYFEMFGNRGVYHKGWSAVTKHRTPWEIAVGTKTIAFDDDVWELYDGSQDWTQARDLSKEQPEKLHELQRLFLIEATKFSVLPLDDRLAERLIPGLAGRPTLIRGTSQTLFPGMGGLNENCVLNLKNKSHSVTAQVVVPEGGANGVLINQGGRTGGWALYVADGRLTYDYNFVGINHYRVAADRPLDAGEHQVRLEFVYDGGGLGKGGTATLYVDGQPAGSGRIERTHIVQYSFDETTDVGCDTGAPVTDDYPARDNAFTGEIAWIRLDLGGDDHGHLLPEEVQLDFLMTRQ